MKKRWLGLAVALACSGAAMAENGFDWGADLRVRYERLGDIPTTSAALTYDQGFWRFRPRVWGQYKPNDDTTLMVRLVNESRIYDDGATPKKPYYWDFFSEFVFDQIYADFQKLGGGMLSLRAGRQDIVYGNGKIFFDGTPLDGSRTLYTNAVKAGIKTSETNQVDLLAIFDKRTDELVINPQGTNYDESLAVVEQDETAFGLYGKNSQIKDVPFEYYYVYKDEDERTVGKYRPEVKFHTFGGRVYPTFNEQWKGNLELAYQTGEHGDADQDGLLFDASVTYTIPTPSPMKPTISAGWYFLSGDDPSTKDNESWHQVFGRWPQISELYLYSLVGSDYSVGGWSNLNAPFVGLDMIPFADSNLSVRYHKLWADEAGGPGGGDNRGDLFTANLAYKYNPQLTGHLRAEYLATGDYHKDGAEDGYFLRANVEYKFK